MKYFIRSNKNLFSYSLIFLIIVPIFGINFFISFLSNILLLLFLIPLFILLLIIVIFNYFKSKINTCSNCGSISLDLSGTCINCGADLKTVRKINKKPSESTIEIKAEEIK